MGLLFWRKNIADWRIPRELLRPAKRAGATSFRLGVAALKQEDFDTAERAFRQAEPLEKDFAAAIMGIGIALLAQGKADEALGHMARCTDLSPGCADVHYWRARALSAANDDAAADEALEMALSLEPGHKASLAFRPSAACQIPKQLMRAAKTVNARSFQSGVRALRMGRFNEAEICFRTASGFDPNSAAAVFGLGLAIVGQRRAKEAQQYLDHCAETASSCADVQYWRARVLLAQNKHEGARRALDQALAIQPEHRASIALQAHKHWRPHLKERATPERRPAKADHAAPRPERLPSEKKALVSSGTSSTRKYILNQEVMELYQSGTTTPWYVASSRKPRMEQLVLDPGALEFRDEPRMLMLTALYLRVYQSFWISVLLKPDDAEYPVILIKANESTGNLKSQPLKIGFSFIKGEGGNMFALFVEFAGPAPFNCPTKPLVFFEDIQGLDHAENRDRLRAQLDADRFDVWLVEGGSAKVVGDVMSADSIDVKHTARLSIDSACRAKLKELLEQHFAEHLRIGPQGWDFKRSFEKFMRDLPVSTPPILADPNPSATRSAPVRSRPSDARRAAWVDPEAEREAAHVVLFFRAEIPGQGAMPTQTKDFILKKAEELGVVITTGTQFHAYRNSPDNLKSVQQGKPIALVAVMEVAAKSGDGEAMFDHHISGNAPTAEFYCPKQGSFFSRTPDCGVVIICR